MCKDSRYCHVLGPRCGTEGNMGKEEDAPFFCPAVTWAECVV